MPLCLLFPATSDRRLLKALTRTNKRKLAHCALIGVILKILSPLPPATLFLSNNALVLLILLLTVAITTMAIVATALT